MKRLPISSAAAVSLQACWDRRMELLIARAPQLESRGEEMSRHAPQQKGENHRHMSMGTILW